MRNVPALDKWSGAEYVEFGTTYSTDTCLSCFMDGKNDVQATHEVGDSKGTKIPVCDRHAEIAKEQIAKKAVTRG